MSVNKQVKQYGPVYLFSNEHIAKFAESFANRRILTVCSSGDHAFCAYLAGAKFVDTFDINLMQKSVMELKKTMIQNVSYEDFLDFFFDYKNFFNPQIIKPIKNKLSESATEFLLLYSQYGPFVFECNYPKVHECNKDFIPYLKTPSDYYALRDKLPENISFLHTDLEFLPNICQRKYDLVYLSNIFDYVYRNETIRNAYQSFYFFVLNRLAKNALGPDGGDIYFRYLWNADVRDVLANYCEYARYCENLDRQQFKVKEIDSMFNDVPGKPDLILFMRHQNYR